MALGDYILERLGDATYTPGVNPAVKLYDPKSGTYHDAQGNSVPLYNQPNWFQRAVSPTADEFAAKNAESQAYPLQQQQQRLTERQGAEQVYNMDDQDFASYGDHPKDTATRLSEQAQRMFGANGGADLLANTLHNTAAGNVSESANRARTAALSGLLGNPEAQADVANLGLQYQGGEYGGETALQPKKFYDEGLGLSNDITQQEQTKEQLPFRGLQGLSEAQRGAQIAGEQEYLTPYEKEEMANEAVGGAAASQYMTPPSPIGDRVDNVNGTVSGPSRNPIGFYGGMQGLGMMGGLNNIPGMPRTNPGINDSYLMSTGPSGAQYPIPVSRATLNALGNNQTQPQYTPPPNIQAQGAGDDSDQQQHNEQLQQSPKYVRGARGTIVRIPQLVGYHYEHGPHGIIIKVPDYQ